MYSHILDKKLLEVSEVIARLEAIKAKELAQKTNKKHILYGYGDDVSSTRYFFPVFVSDESLLKISKHHRRVCCLHA